MPRATFKRTDPDAGRFEDAVLEALHLTMAAYDRHRKHGSGHDLLAANKALSRFDRLNSPRLRYRLGDLPSLAARMPEAVRAYVVRGMARMSGKLAALNSVAKPADIPAVRDALGVAGPGRGPHEAETRAAHRRIVILTQWQFEQMAKGHVPVREHVGELRTEADVFAFVARELGCSPATVRRAWLAAVNDSPELAATYYAARGFAQSRHAKTERVTTASTTPRAPARSIKPRSWR